MKRIFQKCLMGIMTTIVTLCSVTMSSCWGDQFYRTTDIADYGDFYLARSDGRNTKESIAEYMHTVLPERLEDYFTIVTYSYTVDDSYFLWYEGYLEVMIEDESQFQSYVIELMEGMQGELFYYDSAFTEYVLEDGIHLEVDINGNPYISDAMIRKTLINDQTNTLIFESVLTPYSGSNIPIEKLKFFERFNIDLENYYGGDEDKLIIYKRG